MDVLGRFLHDIVSATMKNKGILKGLYDKDEMDSANVSVNFVAFYWT